MAILTARLKSREGGLSEDGTRNYTHVYQVESDVPNVEPAAIDEAVGYAYYSPYPTDPGATLKRIRVVPEGDELTFWTLTYEWDTKRSPLDAGTTQPGEPGTTPSAPGTNAGQTAPEARPWILKWGSVQTERPLEKDRTAGAEFPTGRPVVNSAGQPFDPPVMIPVSNTTLQITAWRSAAQAYKIRAFENKINDAPFLGAARGTGRVTNYAITSQYDNGSWTWQVDVTIEFKEDGWNPVRLLDAGTVERVGSELTGYSFRAITDALGQAVTSAVPLDGFGAKLLAARVLIGDFTYLEFAGYYYATFSELI